MLSRRQFLSGDINGQASAIRPPWSIPEENFIDLCSTCDDCIKACPEAIIIRGRGGYPEVQFSDGACTFCGDCLESCNTGALNQAKNQTPWPIKAKIEQKCFTYQGISCQSCQDACEIEAIRFNYVTSSVAQPELSLNACTGCGACVSVCPANAISIQRSHDGVIGQ